MKDSIDLLDLLKVDHQLISALLEEVENSISTQGVASESLFKDLSLNVRLHSLGEETVLYPKLVQLNESKDIAEDAQEEHQVIAQLIDELEDTDFKEDKWKSLFKALKQNIEHHIEKEESEMFKMVRDLFSEDELIQLSQDFESVTAKPEEKSKVA